MTKFNKRNQVDKNIIEAICKLPKIMKNDIGKSVIFRPKKNSETSEEHISKITHGLQVKDIENIPNILLHPRYKKTDAKHKDRLNYFGIKYKKYRFYRYIKIVTSIEKNREEIITVFLSPKNK